MPTSSRILFFFFFCTLFPVYLLAQDSTVVKVTESKPSLDLSKGLPVSFHAGKRDSLRSLLPDRSMAVIFSGEEKVRSNDVFYPFHQDPNFFYLTGLNEPDALLLLFKEPLSLADDTVTEILFLPGKSVEYEKWNGKRLGTYGAVSELKIQKALVNKDFADFDIDFQYFDEIFYTLPDGTFDDRPGDRGDGASMLKHFFFKTNNLADRLNNNRLGTILSGMRQFKSKEEIALLQKAIDITCLAQNELMKTIDTSFTENEAEAVIEYVFRKSGSEFPGFPSIVGGGKNSCTLHYTSNNEDLSSGDLLVVDIGAEYRNYTADVTRTIPVSGFYTDEQKSIYQLVLKAQREAIDECKVGKKFWDPNEVAKKVIQKGLKELDITKKSHEAKKYFMHGTSHYLGLDVHDIGTYESLKPGNVITVEPGIYIPEGSDCDPKWWNIGIRIEDDILITKDGPVILSDCVPVEIEEIELLMKTQ